MEPNSLTIVYVYSNKLAKFVATLASAIKCPECGKLYADMFWDEDIDRHPMLVCDCGEQYFTWLED